MILQAGPNLEREGGIRDSNTEKCALFFSVKI
jgi:hypothetical protein